MISTNINLAQRYYEAMHSKDLDAMSNYLHDNVYFLGPLFEMQGKYFVLEAAKNFFPFFNNLIIRKKFASDDQVMIVLDMDCPDPINILRTASLLTFENRLISRIELFYDTNKIREMSKNHQQKS
jgi:hypothetical protein